MGADMGTETGIEIVKQIPGIIALIYIVIQFLSHIAKSEDRREKQDERRDLAMKETKIGYEALITKQNEIIERNTEAFHKYTSIAERIEDILSSLPQGAKKPKNPT